MTPQIDIAVTGALGRITLNRPEAINALSLEMIEAITTTLTQWAVDPRIGAVLFTGAGPKGFCAGGDVRAVRALVLAGHLEQADAYFAAEYRMNALIAGYRKPLVALTHGVVMGGGIGIAGHCQFRVTQAGARFAMPESAIGFFADVGVNAILAKAPAPRALLFLLSGVTVGVADALMLGLADIQIGADRVDDFHSELEAAAHSSHPRDAIGRLLAAEAVDPGEAGFCRLADGVAASAAENVAEFSAAVHADPALAHVAATLDGRCPTSLLVSFAAQQAARRHLDVGKTLALDLDVASRMVRRQDFAEGVRAVLVDKDQAPRWQPAESDIVARIAAFSA